MGGSDADDGGEMEEESSVTVVAVWVSSVRNSSGRGVMKVAVEAASVDWDVAIVKCWRQQAGVSELLETRSESERRVVSHCLINLSL